MTDAKAREQLSPLSQHFAEAFLAGQLVLDLPRVTLRRRGAGSTVINGRGFISLESRQAYKLRIYADDNEVDPFLAMRTMASWTPGQEIPNSDYFDLAADDLNGYRWTSEMLVIRATQGAQAIRADGNWS